MNYRKLKLDYYKLYHEYLDMCDSNRVKDIHILTTAMSILYILVKGVSLSIQSRHGDEKALLFIKEMRNFFSDLVIAKSVEAISKNSKEEK